MREQHEARQVRTKQSIKVRKALIGCARGGISSQLSHQLHLQPAGPDASGPVHLHVEQQGQQKAETGFLPRAWAHLQGWSRSLWVAGAQVGLGYIKLSLTQL